MSPVCGSLAAPSCPPRTFTARRFNTPGASSRGFKEEADLAFQSRCQVLKLRLVAQGQAIVGDIGAPHEIGGQIDVEALGQFAALDGGGKDAPRQGGGQARLGAVAVRRLGPRIGLGGLNQGQLRQVEGVGAGIKAGQNLDGRPLRRGTWAGRPPTGCDWGYGSWRSQCSRPIRRGPLEAGRANSRVRCCVTEGPLEWWRCVYDHVQRTRCSLPLGEISLAASGKTSPCARPSGGACHRALGPAISLEKRVTFVERDQICGLHSR